MVKATRVPQQPSPDTRDVQLTLSHDVARTLAKVCDKIGGDPWRSRRGHMDEIGRALDSVGITSRYDDVLAPGASGSITFDNEPGL